MIIKKYTHCRPLICSQIWITLFIEVSISSTTKKPETKYRANKHRKTHLTFLIKQLKTDAPTTTEI